MKTRARSSFVAMLVALACLVVAPRARAEPVRILVAAGSRNGLVAERPLKFASADAGRVRDVVVSLGGVKPENAFVLTEPTRAQLFAAVDRARVEAAKHAVNEVTLLFYFSGHGDRDALHLGDDRLLLADLSNKLGEVPAALRIAVTDACRATRDKGFVADPPFTITATSVPQATGQVWLHASGDGEAAQESDELQGALFTHAWLNGLRGAADANGDARVTLEESFAFAHAQTLLRSAKSSGVLQKPEAIVNLREAAPVVLTEAATRMSTLSLPEGRDVHFLVYSANAKTVFSELWSLPDRRLSLRLPPGRYVVHRRTAGLGASAQLAIAEGEERALQSGDFTATSLGAVAQKGEEPDADRVVSAPPKTKHHEWSVGYDAAFNARTRFAHGPRAAYAYAFSSFALTVGGGVEFSGRTIDEKDERLVGGYGRLDFEGRVPVGALTLRGGAGGRAGVFAQSIETSRAAYGLPSVEDDRSAFFLGPEVFAAARFALDTRGTLFFDAQALGSILFLREASSLRGVATAGGAASLGARF